VFPKSGLGFGNGSRVGGRCVAENGKEELGDRIVGCVICSPDDIKDLGHVGLRFCLFEDVHG
jgi:hypothetical protein